MLDILQQRRRNFLMRGQTPRYAYLGVEAEIAILEETISFMMMPKLAGGEMTLYGMTLLPIESLPSFAPLPDDFIFLSTHNFH